ncbi:MAG: hypothetical protein KGZ25_12885, partial [Planctomycetes bacterium]|nr:hypothetical protein [Planctomycetota bacterium]
MAGIKNWKNLNEGQRGAIVTSIQAGIINVQPGGEGLKDEEVARRLSLFPKQTTKSLASISPKDLNQIAKRYESLAIDAKRYQEMCLKVVADHPVLLLDKKVNAAAAAMRGGFSEARRGLYWDTRDLSSPHDIGDLIRDFGRKTVEEAVVAHAQSAVFSMRPFYSIYAYPRVPYSGPLGKKKLASLKQYIEGRHMYKGVFVIINIRDFWHSIEMVANCLMGRRLPAKPFPIAQRQTALATQFKQISEYMSEAPDFVPLTFGG